MRTDLRSSSITLLRIVCMPTYKCLLWDAWFWLEVRALLKMTNARVWVGNIPLGTCEEDCIDDFVRCGLPRPQKLLLRRGHGRNSLFGIAYMQSEGEALQVLECRRGTLFWWNGKFAVIRCAPSIARRVTSFDFWCARITFKQKKQKTPTCTQ